MTIISSDFFGNHDTSKPAGTDTRRDGDTNLQNLADSMRKQCPNWTNAVTKTHTQVNNSTVINEDERVTGSWTFASKTVWDAAAFPIDFTLAGDQTITKKTSGKMIFDTAAVTQEVQVKVGGTLRLEATNTGVDVTGDLDVTGNVEVNSELRLGGDNIGPADPVAFPAAGNLIVRNASGTILGYISFFPLA